MGNEVRVKVRSEEEILSVRARGKALAEGIGFRSAEATVIATIISEIARNIVEYAQEGEVSFSECHKGMRRGIQIVAVDQGPGIADVV